nr:McmF [Thermoactinomyces sp.]
MIGQQMALQEAVAKAEQWLTVREWEKNHNHILMVADDAWLQQLLIFHCAQQAPAKVAKWEKGVEERLAQTKKIQVAISSPRTQEVTEFVRVADELMGYIMLAHLLYRRYPTEARTKEWLEQVRAGFDEQQTVISRMGHLYSFMYRYNFKKCDLSLPDYFVTTESYKGLPPEVAFLFQSYYYTHIILCEADMLEKPRVDETKHRQILSYIYEQSEWVIQQGLHDLVGEFALCLEVCGQWQHPVYEKLVEHLVTSQETAGNWVHPTYDLRIQRHCTYLGMLALMGAQRRSEDE